MSVLLFLLLLALVVCYLVPILLIYIVTFLTTEDYEKNNGRTDEGNHAGCYACEGSEVSPLP
jgi:hypothetical protein